MYTGCARRPDPAVQCRLVAKELCSGVSVGSVGRVLFCDGSQAFVLGPGRLLRQHDLRRAVATSEPIVSAAINHAGDTVFVATADSGIWMASLNAAGDMGAATQLVNAVVLPDVWYFMQQVGMRCHA